MEQITAKFAALYGREDFWWLVIGLTGQIMFGSRFLVQWVVSEYKKKSVIPVAFWYLSLGGSTILLSYAIYRIDPVFILGQTFGFIVYVRNLVLIFRDPGRRMEAAPPASG